MSALSTDPIPMLLWCPKCGGRHIDDGEFRTRIHHTHACQFCGLVWRPAIVPTAGVNFLPGFKNIEERMEKRKDEKEKDLSSRIREVLSRRLKAVGIDATFDFERVPRTNLLRVTVTAPEFTGMDYSEQQSIVWRAVSNGLKQEDSDRLSMIVTFATPHKKSRKKSR